MKPKIIVALTALAALGAALAIVAQRGGPEPPPTPQPPRPAATVIDVTLEGSAVGEAEGSGGLIVTNQTSREVPERTHVPAEGTGQPAQDGPSVGIDPARADEPVRLLNPVEFRQPTEDDPPGPGEGTGDPASPFGEDDHAAGTITREEQFAAHMQEQYAQLTQRIERCVRGMATTTRDTVHVEMVIREPEPGTTVGTIENFQSASLSGERADCARNSFQAMDFPLPWRATAIEAPGFNVVADTAVEYSMEIEVEIGAE